MTLLSAASHPQCITVQRPLMWFLIVSLVPWMIPKKGDYVMYQCKRDNDPISLGYKLMIMKSFLLFFCCSCWWSIIHLTKSIHDARKGGEQQSTWGNFIISYDALLGVIQVLLVAHWCGFCLQETLSLGWESPVTGKMQLQLYVASLRPVLKLKFPEITTMFILYKRRQDKICLEKTKLPYSNSQTLCVINKIVFQGWECSSMV